MSEKSKTNFSKLGSESGTNFSKLGSESGTNFSKLGTRDDYPGIPNLLRRGAERLETSDVKVFERYRKPRVRDLIPLQGSIQKNGEDWEITVGDGFVIPRHNASGDTGAPITITDLPIEGAELVVVAGDKCYVKLDISVLGKVTTAVFEKAVAWPTDTPPVLAGGDLAGTVGTRHIRILEIVEEDTDFLVVEQIHTGHIDHFQPTLSENVYSSGFAPGQGRVVQMWNAAEGRWDYRVFLEGDGIEIEETTDTIIVRVAPSYAATLSAHPWKVIPNGDDTVDVLPGVTLCVESESTPAQDTLPSFTRLTLQDTFDGSTVTVTGAGYIVGYSAHGVTPQIYSTVATTGVDAESVPISTGRISGSSGITVEFMAALPAGAVAGNFHFVIAEVSLVSSVAVVDRQWITHNPTLDTYFADGT